jgi:hypothetical protein
MSTGKHRKSPTLWTDLVAEVLVPVNPFIKETP